MRWFNLLKANTRKEYIELKRYLPNTLAEMVTFFSIFLAMFFGIKFVGDPNTMDHNIQYTIVSYIAWFLSMYVINFIGWTITNEAMRGTLEQLYMSPMGTWKILFARLISSTMIQLIIIVVLLYLSMLVSGQWLNLDVITILPIFLITLLSMFGVAYIVAGLSIIFKQVQAFLQILQFILMGLAFIPIAVSPYLALAPFVKGIDMIREVMIHSTTLSQFSWLDYVILASNGVVYFIIGIVIFFRCEKVAMDKGLLGHY